MKKGADYDNFYENLEEASFRLNQSVVLYDGEPVYVHSLEDHKDGIVRVQIAKLPLPEDGSAPPTTRKMINSPKFNKFRPFEMGNCNLLIRGVIHPVRIERVPVRTRLQGTTQGNTHIDPLFLSSSGQGVGWANVITNEGFVEMVKGIYPTWEEYKESGIISCALSRDFSVSFETTVGVVYLKYKTNHIGFVSEKGSAVIFPRFTYLKEVVENSQLFKEVQTGLFVS